MESSLQQLWHLESLQFQVILNVLLIVSMLKTLVCLTHPPPPTPQKSESCFVSHHNHCDNKSNIPCSGSVTFSCDVESLLHAESLGHIYYWRILEACMITFVAVSYDLYYSMTRAHNEEPGKHHPSFDFFPDASHTMEWPEIFSIPATSAAGGRQALRHSWTYHTPVCGTYVKNSTAGLLTVKWIQLLLVFSWGFQPPQRVINLDPAL